MIAANTVGFAALFFLLGVILGYGLGLIIHAEQVAHQWGQEMAALRKSVPASTEIQDVRIIVRGVPTDDGGDDLL